jgi:hypothetical protein
VLIVGLEIAGSPCFGSRGVGRAGRPAISRRSWGCFPEFGPGYCSGDCWYLKGNNFLFLLTINNHPNNNPAQFRRSALAILWKSVLETPHFQEDRPVLHPARRKGRWRSGLEQWGVHRGAGGQPSRGCRGDILGLEGEHRRSRAGCGVSSSCG